MLQVIDIDLHDRDIGWVPDDPYDIDEWATVNIGEYGAGNYYQIHLCTNTLISQIENKRHLFVLSEWVSIEKVIESINEFIEDKLTENIKEDPYIVLSRFWAWEYEGYKS